MSRRASASTVLLPLAQTGQRQPCRRQLEHSSHTTACPGRRRLYLSLPSLSVPGIGRCASSSLPAILRHRHARGTVASAVVESVASSRPSGAASARMHPCACQHPCSSMAASSLSTSPSPRNAASFRFLSSPPSPPSVSVSTRAAHARHHHCTSHPIASHGDARRSRSLRSTMTSMPC